MLSGGSVDGGAVSGHIDFQRAFGRAGTAPLEAVTQRDDAAEVHGTKIDGDGLCLVRGVIDGKGALEAETLFDVLDQHVAVADALADVGL